MGIDLSGIRETQSGVTIKCPFSSHTHSNGTDNKPGFGITEEGVYHCFSCKQKGSLTFLPSRLEKVCDTKFDIATKAEYSMLVVRELLDKPKDIRKKKPETYTTGLEVEYLTYKMFAKRSLKSETYTEFLLKRGINQYAEHKFALVEDLEHGGVKFPMFDGDGEYLGFSTRLYLDKPSKTFTQANFKVTDTFLNLQDYRSGKPILLVEGLMGVASALSNGADKTFTLLAACGSHLSKKQADILEKLDEAVYIYFDADMAGNQGTINAVNMLRRKARVYVPRNFTDIDDLKEADFARITATTVPFTYK